MENSSLHKPRRYGARIGVRLRASEREALIAFAEKINEPVGEVIRLALAAYIGRPFTERKQSEQKHKTKEQSGP